MSFPVPKWFIRHTSSSSDRLAHFMTASVMTSSSLWAFSTSHVEEAQVTNIYDADVCQYAIVRKTREREGENLFRLDGFYTFQQEQDLSEVQKRIPGVVMTLEPALEHPVHERAYCARGDFVEYGSFPLKRLACDEQDDCPSPKRKRTETPDPYDKVKETCDESKETCDQTNQTCDDLNDSTLDLPSSCSQVDCHPIPEDRVQDDDEEDKNGNNNNDSDDTDDVKDDKDSDDDCSSPSQKSVSSQAIRGEGLWETAESIYSLVQKHLASADTDPTNSSRERDIVLLAICNLLAQ